MPKKIKIKTGKTTPSVPAAHLYAAIQHFKSGDYKYAEMICRQILTKSPAHADAWHLLGLIAVNSGQLDKAIEYFSSAIRCNPRDYSYYYNLGNAYADNGAPELAIDAFKKALALCPDNAGIYNNLGSAYLVQKMYDEAIEDFKKALALDSENAGLYNNLGNAYKEKGMLDEAMDSFSMAVKLRPDYANAYNDLGIVLDRKGLTERAIENYRTALSLRNDFDKAYVNLAAALNQKGLHHEAMENARKALALDPGSAEAYNNLAYALAETGSADEAIECAGKALECAGKALALQPDNPEVYNNLAFALNQKGLYEEAMESARKALALDPGNAEAYLNLGGALTGMGMYDEAIEIYKKALSLRNGFDKAYNNLAGVLADKGMLDEAIFNYRKAVDLNSHDFKTHFNLGICYLLAKDFDKGWDEYEWRLKDIECHPLVKPKWDGTSLEGRSILVYAEQGYGDTLQFLRYLPLLYDEYKAEKILFIPQKGLEALLRENRDTLKAEILDANVIARSAEAISRNEIPRFTRNDSSVISSLGMLEYDTNIHLLSLPRIFKTNLDNIPFKGRRYLKANPEKVSWYRERFFNFEIRNSKFEFLKIGIYWHGSPTFKAAKDKAIPLECFYPVARLSNIKVYSLQKGQGIKQLDGLPGDLDIANLGETFNDFSDTAAAIENLDMVITIDTAVAHLSGAMGKKTWLLHPSFAEWRWHLDMDHSPWYEDFKIFRHKETGKKDWDEMMERVKRELEAEVNAN